MSRPDPSHRRGRALAAIAFPMLRIVGSVALLLGLTSLAYYLVLRHTHNVACVVAGAVYRSAQMPEETLRETIQTYHLRSVLKPILIHCEAGADRTGLVSALVLLAADVTPERAHAQLCLWYLHFPYCGSATIAMDHSFDEYLEARSRPPDLRQTLAPSADPMTRR